MLLSFHLRIKSYDSRISDEVAEILAEFVEARDALLAELVEKHWLDLVPKLFSQLSKTMMVVRLCV